MLVEAYGSNALSRTQCYRWFEKFKNSDFGVGNKERSKPANKFEDAELQALLNEDDDQTQKHLSEQLNVDQSTVSRHLKAMSKKIKVGRLSAHELTDSQRKNGKIVCEMLLARYKVISPSHCDWRGKIDLFGESQAYVIIFGSRTIVQIDRKIMLCIFGDQEGPIYYEFLKPGETVNTNSYKQKILALNNSKNASNKETEAQSHFPGWNASSYGAKATKDIVKMLGREPLAQTAYSPDLAPSDYHLFASLGHELAGQRFTSSQNVKSWLDDWLASKDR